MRMFFKMMPLFVQKHCQRVALYTEQLYIRALDNHVYPDDPSLDECYRGEIGRIAVWHDVGKFLLPTELLNKPGELTSEESALMRRHTVYAKTIFDQGFLPEDLQKNEREIALMMAYGHHERWDGNGYPCGLKGEQTPVVARICAIADAYDAIISSRPYKQARSFEKARQEISKNAGTQFDPVLVKLFTEYAAGDE